MKIYRVEQPNGDFIEAIAPDPVAKAGEVLIRIHASGVNPLDTKIRAGQAAHARQPLPAVLGLDMAGVVEEVGEGITAFKPGDEVLKTGDRRNVPQFFDEWRLVSVRSVPSFFYSLSEGSQSSTLLPSGSLTHAKFP